MRISPATLLSSVVFWTVRLIPAAALFSAFFALEGSLRWIGLFGFIPLVLALARVPGCACAARGKEDAGFRPWPSF
jgi:hypothetical protein